MQVSQVYTGNSNTAKSLGYQLLVEGKRDAFSLPDDCEVMGILDETGESLTETSYIGAQRRDSTDPMSQQHSASVITASTNLTSNSLKEQEIQQKALEE